MRRAAVGFFHSWKADLFREPGERGRWNFTLGLLLASLLFYYGLFAVPRTPNPLVLAMAGWGLLRALAELLPRERTTLAGILRAGSHAAFASMFIVVVVLIFTGNT